MSTNEYSDLFRLAYNRVCIRSQEMKHNTHDKLDAWDHKSNGQNMQKMPTEGSSSITAYDRLYNEHAC